MGDCMVEMKQLNLKNKTVLGIQILLPNISVHYIVYQHHILCDEKMDIGRILDRSPTVSAMMVETARCFEDLLEGTVEFVSPRMKRVGIQTGMKGQDALEMLP